jgi:uncharacterized protein
MTRVDSDHVVGTRRRPGWPEILVGLAVFAAVGYGLPVLFGRFGVADALGPVTYGLILTGWSGIAGLLGFLAADRLRIRSAAAFGVRGISWKWVLIGIAGGIVALLLGRLAAVGVIAVFGPQPNVQQSYADAASGGTATVVVSLVLLAVLTPLGEEFVFRGVVTTALLRYGPWIGVLGSALIFALMHGINPAFMTALIVGLVAGELRRRSDSLWPGVLVHVVNNLLGQALFLFVAS